MNITSPFSPKTTHILHTLEAWTRILQHRVKWHHFSLSSKILARKVMCSLIHVRTRKTKPNETSTDMINRVKFKCYMAKWNSQNMWICWLGRKFQMEHNLNSRNSCEGIIGFYLIDRGRHSCIIIDFKKMLLNLVSIKQYCKV